MIRTKDFMALSWRELLDQARMWGTENPSIEICGMISDFYPIEGITKFRMKVCYTENTEEIKGGM